MFIIFSTNSSITADGFELYYPKSTLGINEKSSLTELKVFPNPAHDQVNVSFRCDSETHLEMTLSSIQGQPLAVKNAVCPAGMKSVEYSC